ncbi:SMC-Scp complex subunit ScpB [Candidatus Woesearchaeota archaeon]|nr:SMC-Scp complex subunit ScpB [Candidatus Woesearchaeota archaeon]
MTEIMKKAEAILFAIGRAVSEQEISELTKESKSDVHEALIKLKQQYMERESPLMIIEEGDSWKLNVHEKYINVVHQITPHTELGRSMLETLAVIAWKQPATQSEIVKIRTTKAYEHIAELEKMGYIAKHKHGRTYLIKVTGKFYDYFDLPGEHAVKEMFKDIKDVEEAQTKLEMPEKINGLPVFEVPEEEITQEVGELEEPEKHLFTEELEEKEEKKESVESFIEENQPKPAPQEIEEGLVEESEEVEKENKKETEENKEAEEPEEKEVEPEKKEDERELDSELEEFAKDKKKKD